ncbi:MAG: hypothetical protein KAS99_02990 [Candidatus Omnitrophica bacterium]|nr:hypothetical protein [Candidatus Omnitrophota bacterium]
MRKKQEKKDFETNFYENLLKQRPNFIQALSCLGDVYTKKGFYKKGLDIDKKLVELKPEDPIIRYNLACSFSLLKEEERALEELKKAVLYGYDDFSYILKDEDLKNIRRHHKFGDFFRKLKRVKI